MGEPIRADAIVLLGCRIGEDGHPTLPARRRAVTAALAYELGVAPVVVVSGGRRWSGHAEATALAHELRRQGVPSHAIQPELCSLSTVENAVYSAALLGRLGARRAAIVTCWWHMPRALESFRAVGLDPVPFPTEERSLGPGRAAYLFAHERVCSWLDARARRRWVSLRAGHERIAGGA